MNSEEIIVHSMSDPALELRINSTEQFVYYRYGENPRWRKTPITIDFYLQDARAAADAVYDFFDQQWRGC